MQTQFTSRQLPSLRFAVFTDLHVGSTTANRWHNHFLSDDPAGTVAATVATVNAERPEFVVVLGDLSDHGSEPELRAARAVLDGIAAPWIVCQGNHDVAEGGDRAAYDRVFGDRAPVGVLPDGRLPLPAGVASVSLEATWSNAGGSWRVFVPDQLAQQVTTQLAAARPDLLLVFCHFPLVRQSAYTAAMGGKNAGTLWEGEALLEALSASAGTTLVFTGHQHFHHIATGPGDADPARWLHCTTASLAEYPADYRVISLGPAGIDIQTTCGAPAIVAAAPPPEVTWVAALTPRPGSPYPLLPSPRPLL